MHLVDMSVFECSAGFRVENCILLGDPLETATVPDANIVFCRLHQSVEALWIGGWLYVVGTVAVSG